MLQPAARSAADCVTEPEGGGKKQQAGHSGHCVQDKRRRWLHHRHHHNRERWVHSKYGIHHVNLSSYGHTLRLVIPNTGVSTSSALYRVSDI